MKRNVYGRKRFGSILLWVVVAGLGCSTSKKDPSCTTGNEGCRCYGNSTCNSELQCYSDLCVYIEESAGAAGFQYAGTGGDKSTNSVGTSATSSVGTSATSSGGTSATSSGGTSATSSGGTSATMNTGNLITNGDFTQEKAHWSLTAQGIATNLWSSVGSGSYCFGAETELNFTLSWPDSVAAGVSLTVAGIYRIAYTLRASQAYTVTAKVREVAAPNTTISSMAIDVPTTDRAVYQDFSVPSGLGRIGVAFVGVLPSSSLQYVCVSAVSLARIH